MALLARLCISFVVGLSGLIAADRLAQPDATFARTYVVQANDTLSAISVRFHISMAELASMNGIANPDRLQAGQVLDVPDGAGSGRMPRRSGQDGQNNLRGRPEVYANATQSTQGSYVVEAGDTLSALSDHFGVPIDLLAAANGIQRTDLLLTGQHLRIPTLGSGGLAAVTAVPTVQASDFGTTVPVATMTAVMYGGGVPSATSTASQAEVGTLLASQAQAYGIDPALVKAVAWQESGWSMVIARDGGIGVMQLMPATAAWVGPDFLGRAINPYNLQDNIQAGVALLASYLRQYGDVRLALAAYNEGQQNLQRGILSSTAQYIANVLALQARFAQ